MAVSFSHETDSSPARPRARQAASTGDRRAGRPFGEHAPRLEAPRPIRGSSLDQTAGGGARAPRPPTPPPRPSLGRLGIGPSAAPPRASSEGGLATLPLRRAPARLTGFLLHRSSGSASSSTFAQLKHPAAAHCFVPPLSRVQQGRASGGPSPVRGSGLSVRGRRPCCGRWASGRPRERRPPACRGGAVHRHVRA